MANSLRGVPGSQPVTAKVGIFFTDMGYTKSLAPGQAPKRKGRRFCPLYHAMRKTMRYGFCVLAPDSRILQANEAFCRLSGYRRDELEAMKIIDLELEESRQDSLKRIQTIIDHGSAQFEILQQRRDGEIWPVDVSASFSRVKGGRLFWFLRDISERKQEQRLVELRQQLESLVRLGDQDQILRAALDGAEELTYSRIGFLHFVEKNQEEVSLQVWSTRTLAEMCFTEGKGRHYPVSQAGVWVDCIHQRQPVIHNDYASLPHKKGLPVGHASLMREATVPLIRHDNVNAVIGVGNKPSDYGDQDTELLQQVIEMAFEFLERQKVERHLEHIAYYDALTGLPNRSLLTDRISQALAHGKGTKELIAICYLDLDDFKRINDDYGYQVGDALLVSLARRLRQHLRQSDSLARLGGDQFVYILTGLRSNHECREAIQRILSLIRNPIDVQGHRLLVSASMGVTLCPADQGGPEALLRHAHEAMYQAKVANKAGYHLYDPVQDKQVRQRRRLLEEFEFALQNHQLILVYQPRIALRNGKVVGVEALIRWRHPREGLLAPASFLSLIEDTPLEIAMGEWVVTTALNQQQLWREAGLSLSVSVNIRPTHIKTEGFVDFLTRTLPSYSGTAAEKLEIEILEISALGNTADAAKVMNACKDLGIRFALDDFGTGYSTLTYFHHLPIDVVKIDHHFIGNMLERNEDLSIVEGVLKMSRALQRPAVAEGVESVEIAFMLYQLGCEFAQGYGIAPPLLAEQIPTWLTEWKERPLWHRLREESLVGSSNADLNVAIFSLRNWLEQALGYLRAEEGGVLPTLEEHQSQFCRWYHGIGQCRYGTHPHYAFLQARHHQLHQFVEDLSQGEGGAVRDVQARIEELEKLGKEMIETLKMLEWPWEVPGRL